MLRCCRVFHFIWLWWSLSGVAQVVSRRPHGICAVRYVDSQQQREDATNHAQTEVADIVSAATRKPARRTAKKRSPTASRSTTGKPAASLPANVPVPREVVHAAHGHAEAACNTFDNAVGMDQVGVQWGFVSWTEDWALTRAVASKPCSTRHRLGPLAKQGAIPWDFVTDYPEPDGCYGVSDIQGRT